jgi:hypothetical protein
MGGRALQQQTRGVSGTSGQKSSRQSRVAKGPLTPHLTCSPVSGFLLNRSCAVRIASTPSMALINPRT